MYSLARTYVYRCGAYVEHPITPFPASQTRRPSEATVARRFDNALPAHQAVIARANAYFSRHRGAGVRRGRQYRRCPRWVCLRWTLNVRCARTRNTYSGMESQCAQWGRVTPLDLAGCGTGGQECRYGCVKGKGDGVLGVGSWRVRCALLLMTYSMRRRGKVLRWRT